MKEAYDSSFYDYCQQQADTFFAEGEALFMQAHRLDAKAEQAEAAGDLDGLMELLTWKILSRRASDVSLSLACEYQSRIEGWQLPD